MRFGDLTYIEIRERAGQGWLAIVPTGCTEQQGPHLPVDFDTWFAETVCAAAADRAALEHDVNSLLLPAIPYGPTPEHRSYGSGYIDLPQDIHDAAISSVLVSLGAQGFGRIVVWRGCGQHDLQNVVDRFNEQQVGRARAFLPALPYHDIWCQVGDATILGGHADSFATSIALHLRPGTVRTDRIRDPENREVDWSDSDLDFSAYSSTGVIGDPTHASAELGARLWAAIVESVARTLREIATTGVD